MPFASAMDSTQTRSEMKYEVFKNAVSLICSYWNRKMPTDSQLQTWFPPIDYIPGPALEWIVDKINDQDRAPANIPRALKTGWWDYLREYPDKVEKSKQTPCAECHSRGVIIGQYFDIKLGYTYSYVARCPKCENWKRHFGSKHELVPFLTRDKITKRGHSVVGLLMTERVKPVDPRKLAAGIGTDISKSYNPPRPPDIETQKRILRERGHVI